MEATWAVTWGVKCTGVIEWWMLRLKWMTVTRPPRQEGNPFYKLLTGGEIRPVLHHSIHQRMYCLHTIGLNWNMSNSCSICRSVVQKWTYVCFIFIPTLSQINFYKHFAPVFNSHIHISCEYIKLTHMTSYTHSLKWLSTAESYKSFLDLNVTDLICCVSLCFELRWSKPQRQTYT